MILNGNYASCNILYLEHKRKDENTFPPHTISIMLSVEIVLQWSEVQSCK